MLHSIVSQIAQIVSSIISTFGYPGILLVMVAENVFPPIPSEAVLPFAGFLASQDRFNLFWVVIAGMLGSVIGALCLYAFGYYGNELLIRRFLRRWGKWFLLSEEDLDKSLVWFKHYGRPAVFTARMVPLIRSLISIPAGLTKMPLFTFILLTSFGTALWSFFLTYAGYLLGENWQLVGQVLGRYEKAVLIIIVIILIFFFWRKLYSLKNKKSSSSCL